MEPITEAATAPAPAFALAGAPNVSAAPAPPVNWSLMKSSDHFVQFYEHDASLIAAVCGFMSAGLEAGDACIVIATPEHLDALERCMRSRGADVREAAALGRYVALDAETALAGFMVDGAPDARLFRATVGRTVADAAERGVRVRAFGEMVALLWAEGNRVAAVELERLWNDLARHAAFCLFCAYPMDGCTGADAADAFVQVCAHHARVLPSESYAALEDPEDRLREIALLQQKARSLEAEIAQRRQAEEALSRRERELADFFENSNEGMHRVGPDGTVLWANRAEMELLGYTADEYIGHDVREFYADLDMVEDMLQKLSCGEALVDYPAVMRAKDGSIKHVLVHSTACIENGELAYTRCFARDVTERRRMEQVLQERLDEIEALNVQLRRSVTETHHRVKNNLQVVSAMIEMQAMEHEEDQAVPLEVFHRLKAHVRTLAIVHDLLTASTKEDAAGQRVSTSAVLEKLLPMLQNTAWKRTVRYDIADVSIPSKQCVALALVLNELVTNALKHGRSEADVSFTAADGQAVLEVSDDGPGFPPDFDAAAAANTGLDLVEGVARTDLAGTVSYETRAQGGGRVRIVFPLPTADA